MGKGIPQDIASAKMYPVQGADPVVDEGLGLLIFRRYGCSWQLLPKPLATMFRSAVSGLLREPERDMVFAELIFKWFAVNFPVWLAVLYFIDYTARPYLFLAVWALHFLLWFDSFETYILGLHCICHRHMFLHQSKAIKWCFVWLLGPMFGETPETYASHHIGMHHPKNNGFDDLSTTMTYRRDSLWDFARYVGRFLVVHKELYDALKNVNRKSCRRFVTGEVSWLVVGLITYYFRPMPAVLCYFFPVLLLRVGMTAGNWGQHAFINDADPFHNNNQSAVIVDSEYNTKAFNDGYHIMHHNNPTAHYMDLPKLFVADMPNLAKHDSIVFTSKRGGDVIDWPSVTILLMRGRYDVLADHFVDCRHLAGLGPKRSKDEIIKLLKSRTCKVYDQKAYPDTIKKAK